MKRKVLAWLVASLMVFSLAGCGSSSDSGSKDASSDAAADDGAADADADAADDGGSGDLIKVGIINNDPNESGYRTANEGNVHGGERLWGFLRIQLKE